MYTKKLLEKKKLSELLTTKQSTNTEIAMTVDLAQLKFFELGNEILEIRFLLMVCICRG